MIPPSFPITPYDPATLDVLRRRARDALRTRLRGLRAALPRDAATTLSTSIARSVIALDVWQNARSVALYSSIPYEVCTRDLFSDARARGLRVSLPVVVRDSPLEFREAFGQGGDQALVPGIWGILEPTESSPVVDPRSLDLILVPALAVDPRGYRLGYGKGHYDRTLPLAENATRVAVVFDFQLIAEVPDYDHDVPVDQVVTDRRVLLATAGRLPLRDPPNHDREKP